MSYGRGLAETRAGAERGGTEVGMVVVKRRGVRASSGIDPRAYRFFRSQCEIKKTRASSFAV